MILKQAPPATVTFWYYSTGSLATIPLAAYFAARDGPAKFFHFPDLESAAALAYAIVFATVFAYVMISWASTVTSATNVAAYMTLQPFWTALLSFFFLSEDIYPLQVQDVALPCIVW